MPMTMSEAGKLGYEKSKETLNKLKQERLDKYYINPKLCLVCKKIIEYKVKRWRCL